MEISAADPAPQDQDAPRCAVLDDYQGVAFTAADWSPLDGRVRAHAVTRPLAGVDDLVETVGGCEILVAMRERTPFPAEAIERLARRGLRLLVTTGPRNASIDLEAAARHGVTVCGTDSTASPTVELTWALILAAARGIVPENESLRGGGWQHTVGADLSGRCLGLVGLGRLGSRVAQVGRAFGMDVLAWSANLTAERAAEAGARLAGSLDELMAQADFVSVHLVLGERTRGLIGAAELRRMKQSAYFVNTSRAGLVDQDALATALEQGWIAGAAADVFDTEPLPAGDRFRTLPNFLATPHLGYVTRANYELFYGGAVQDIAAFLDGAPVRVIER